MAGTEPNVSRYYPNFHGVTTDPNRDLKVEFNIPDALPKPTMRQMTERMREIRDVKEELHFLEPGVSWPLTPTPLDVEYFNLREDMVRHNLTLVMMEVSKYRERDVPLEDLFQAGSMGLTRAVEKYDPAIGEFSHYALWWIADEVTKAVQKYSNSIDVPRIQNKEVARYSNVYYKLLCETGIEPTDEEVARHMNITTTAIDRLKKIASMRNSKSIFEPLHQDGVDDPDNGLTITDMIPAPDKTDAEAIRNIDIEDALQRLSRVLNRKELTYIAMRLQGHTHEEIAEKLGYMNRQGSQMLGQRLLKKLEKKGHLSS